MTRHDVIHLSIILNTHDSPKGFFTKHNKHLFLIERVTANKPQNLMFKIVITSGSRWW